MNNIVQFNDLSEEAKEIAVNEVVKNYKTNSSIQKKLEKILERDLNAALIKVHVKVESFYIDFEKNKLTGMRNVQLLSTALSAWLSDQQNLELDTMKERKSPLTVDLYIKQNDGYPYCQFDIDLTPKELATQKEVLDVLKVTNQKEYHDQRIKALLKNFKLTDEIYADFKTSITNSLKEIKKTIDAELWEIKNNVQNALDGYFSTIETTKLYIKTSLVSGHFNPLFYQDGTLF